MILHCLTVIAIVVQKNVVSECFRDGMNACETMRTYRFGSTLKGNAQHVQEGGRVLVQEGRRQSRKLEKALANSRWDLELQQKHLY